MARKPRPPLKPESLNELALTYVGRFATSRATLRSYLKRKIHERGWDGPGEADPEPLIERFAAQGYIDDAAYAVSKSRSLTGRGFGTQRVRQALRVAGIADEDSAEARAHAEQESVESALRFARRRRIGPFAEAASDQAARQKALSAMIRAGHGFGLARAIVAMSPGELVDAEELIERYGAVND